MEKKLTQVAFRFPEALIERIDDYARRMEAEMPGLRFTRADAVRVLLERALAEEGVLAEDGKKPRRR